MTFKLSKKSFADFTRVTSAAVEYQLQFPERKVSNKTMFSVVYRHLQEARSYPSMSVTEYVMYFQSSILLDKSLKVSDDCAL
jgi:hypothetical protein